MKYIVKISDDAYWDLVDAIDYYKNISSEDLANKFRKEFRLCLEKITENPKAFAVKYKSIRFMNFSKFPHQIHFYLKEDVLFVVGVFHSKSNPKNWEKRF